MKVVIQLESRFSSVKLEMYELQLLMQSSCMGFCFLGILFEHCPRESGDSLCAGGLRTFIFHWLFFFFFFTPGQKLCVMPFSIIFGNFIRLYSRRTCSEGAASVVTFVSDGGRLNFGDQHRFLVIGL